MKSEKRMDYSRLVLFSDCKVSFTGLAWTAAFRTLGRG